ncbi:Gfo/Idh/MocA family protein [Aquibacillus kalidii]|uniref:Gfo/Idh/MocA family protein n=1 Tax=Aquibacillus kalidii TaxID=2762597 RepID=UPI0016471277|nr:Gfo/Idh/MocA family oxidoreductase [Aquibacillus kalidii]
MQQVSIVLVGMSGYGNVYLKEILDQKNDTSHLIGVVDIYPERSDFYEEIIQQGIPIYTSLEAFYEKASADLAIIATPIQLHAKQSCYCMDHGSHVLCEKPMTGNPSDIDTMIQTRDLSDRFLAIGFNWSFTESIQALKKDILNDVFGKPLRMKSIALWPRNQDYFNRSPWAGKKYSPSGDMIFDSVANNATAHFIHNMFYLLGSAIESSAHIRDLSAELYRTNAIETFDTCALHFQTDENVDIYYYATHTVKETVEPQFHFEFEKATITYDSNDGNGTITATFTDGSVKTYQDPQQDHLAKLRVCINAIKEQHKHILCGPEAAATHVQSIQAIHQSIHDVPSFPWSKIKFDEDQKLYWIDGLKEDLLKCYTNWSLPGDLEMSWSKK